MIDNAKDLLRELKNVSRQYENEKLYTFEVSRKRMADDCIKIVEQQEKQIAELEKEIKELKAENEKMKCCGNCKHKENKLEENEICWNCERSCAKFGEEIIKDEWELAE